jgi:hypothetical protein
MNLRSNLLRFGAFTLALTLARPAGFAATPTQQSPGHKQASPAAPGEVQTLQQAYSLLAGADHDYQGHRMRAMHAIKGACRLLGGQAQGEGAGNEPQGTSDGQLKQAQGLLQNVLATATAANQTRVVHHIDKAIEELGVALSIK